MDQQKLDMYIMTNQKYFPEEKMMFLKDKLKNVEEERFSMISTVKLKDPTFVLIMSLFFGCFGVDRFILGQTGAGVGKLLTAGGCGIWAFIDWFLIGKATREKNFNNVMTLL